MPTTTIPTKAFLASQEVRRLEHALSVAAAQFHTDAETFRATATQAAEMEAAGGMPFMTSVAAIRMAAEFDRYATETEALSEKLDKAPAVAFLQSWE